MGCDIHCYIEYRYPKHDDWTSFGGRINPGRNYGLFAKLAGVRNYDDVTPVAEPRGIPADMSDGTGRSYWMYVTEAPGDGHCTPEVAKQYVQYGAKYKDERENFVSNPDWHSHSWLTPDEYAVAIGDSGEPEYDAILAAMRSFEENGFQARIVFWFDS